MLMQPARQHMSLEQYLLLVTNTDRHYEYYDGEVRLMAGGSSNHAAIALNFGMALDQALGDDAVMLRLRCASSTGASPSLRRSNRWRKNTKTKTKEKLTDRC